MNGTDKLCQALYGRDAQSRDYLGCADARMLHDAAETILNLRAELADERARLDYLTEHPSSVKHTYQKLWYLWPDTEQAVPVSLREAIDKARTPP